MQNSIKRFNKGFTLIELLVVVAIIGLLVAVVMAFTGGARGKAADDKIISQLNSMRTQSLLFTGVEVQFLGDCVPTSNTIFETTNNGFGVLLGGLTSTDAVCMQYFSNWLVFARLANNRAWCVDYTGTGRSKDSVGTPYLYDGDFSYPGPTYSGTLVGLPVQIAQPISGWRCL